MADTRAGAYQKRIAGVFAQSASTITVVRAGASHSVSCFIEPMGVDSVGVYFDGNESVGLLRPALMVWLANTTDMVADDLFTYDAGNRTGGDLYTVRKLHFFRQGITPLVILALCD